jgi:regulator of ribonuclease activity B
MFNFRKLFSSSKPTDGDEAVLKQLAKAGSRLSQSHNIEFFLYFPTESVAQEAASRIKKLGFGVKVGPAAQGPQWLCFVTKEMVPELAALQKIRTDFEQLATSLGGEYDGWGTGVVL